MKMLIEAGAAFGEIVGRPFQYSEDYPLASFKHPISKLRFTETDGVNHELIKAIYQKIVEEERKFFNDTVDIKERRDVKSATDHRRLRFFGFPEYTREIFKANCRRVIQSLERERIRDALLDVSTDFTALHVERTSDSSTVLPTPQQGMTPAYAAMRKAQPFAGNAMDAVIVREPAACPGLSSF